MKCTHWPIKYLLNKIGWNGLMISSKGNIFRGTGHLCGKFTGHRWSPRTQRPVTQSFVVFFDLRLNERLSEQSLGWWFETPSRPLWRHGNGEVTTLKRFMHYRPFVRETHQSPVVSLHKRPVMGLGFNVSFAEWTFELPTIWPGMTLIWHHCNELSWHLPGFWFNIKMSSYQQRKSNRGDKTVVRSSYLHNGISYTGKMSSLYWIRALIPVSEL